MVEFAVSQRLSQIVFEVRNLMIRPFSFVEKLHQCRLSSFVSSGSFDQTPSTRLYHQDSSVDLCPVFQSRDP